MSSRTASKPIHVEFGVRARAFFHIVSYAVALDGYPQVLEIWFGKFEVGVLISFVVGYIDLMGRIGMGGR